jgi:outer membrane protein assembly factor BamB
LPASATLPLARSAREIEEDVLMASGPGGTLLVSIPTLTGSVLALLDGDGKPRPGWPIAMQDSCDLLLPLEDGSVLVVCDPPGFETPEDVRAFAFGPDGHPRAGWPVQLGRDLTITGRMVGDELTLVAGHYDSVPKVSVRLVAPDGTIRRGADVSHECCYGWAVAPDGIAYGSGWGPAPPYDSRITAVDPAGLRPGWPVEFGGRTSAPAFAPDGRIVVVVGPVAGDTSRVLVFDRAGTDASATSADLPLEVVVPLGSGDVDCGPSGSPRAPIVGDDGTIFVWSELDKTVFALDPSLVIRPGWPFEPATGLVYRSYQDPRAELSCGSPASPAIGPGSTLYMPLQARSTKVGGSIIAVGPDGRVRSGWPVELKRPGAEFWSVVVGSDGTVYALAIEPEAGDTSSASLLALDPDSTVRWTTTIIEP